MNGLAEFHRRTCELKTSEHKRRQEKAMILDHHEMYRIFFDNSKDALYFTDKHGKFIEVNQSFLGLFGYTREEIAMLKAQSVYVNSNDRQKFRQEIERNGSVRDYELKLQKKDGAEMHCLISATIHRADGGGILGYQGFIRDITEQKLQHYKLQVTLGKLRKTLGTTIQAIALTVETRDPYTSGHQQRVADLARAIATYMGLSEKEIEGIRMAAIIHDLGKTSVPAEILSKPGRLNEYEAGIIKSHPRVGYEILKEIEFPWPIAQIVLQHHERINGTGYPQGLSRQDILMEARIIGVADVIEAMASHRPYRAALGIDKALEEIMQKKGILYDPQVVEAAYKLFVEKGFKFRLPMRGAIPYYHTDQVFISASEPC